MLKIETYKKSRFVWFYMGMNSDNMIKGRIAETIVEEMFRDLGFFVMRLGQENVVNPILQMRDFIKECGGDFKLSYDKYLYYTEISYLQKLPDFCIVSKEGKVKFVEVKFRRGGMIDEDATDVFQLYPQTALLVVNLEVGEKISYAKRSDTKVGGEVSKEVLEEIKKNRFNIWERGSYEELETKTLQENKDIKVDKKTMMATLTRTFRGWLKMNFDIESEEIISKYEDLVVKWFGKGK